MWRLISAETIVSNESSEIIRMFYTEFDAFIPEHLRELSKGDKTLLPEHLRKEIDAMNDWVYNDINNGVYKTGFATSQDAYEEHVYKVFQGLDRVEEHLGQPGHSPYLFGDHITDADIRLYTTLIRFDVAYFGIMKCNLKMIRYEYPRLHDWLRRLYWDESERTNGGAFKKTVNFQAVSFEMNMYLEAIADNASSTKTDIVTHSRQKLCLLGRCRISYHCDHGSMHNPGVSICRGLEGERKNVAVENQYHDSLLFTSCKNLHLDATLLLYTTVKHYEGAERCLGAQES
jgi:hypothetical protein